MSSLGRAIPVTLLAAAAGTFVAWKLYGLLKPVALPPSRAVCLVTGCDTGIGHATAVLLSELKDSAGEAQFKVLAGCLTEVGVAELKSLGRPNLVPFSLDVANEESVKSMAALAERECDGEGLFALYNVAGINAGNFADLTTMDEWKKVFDVNLFGMVRCTMAVYHLLHQSAFHARLANARGRPTLRPKVISISSIAAEIPLTSAAAYTASKHAAKGFMNVLRIEAKPFGIDVVDVRPFWVATNIVPDQKAVSETVKARLLGNFGDPSPDGEQRDPFGKENPLNRYVGGVEGIVKRGIESTRMLPDRKDMMQPRYIAEQMAAQMLAERPRMTLMLYGRTSELLSYEAMRHFPTTLMNLMANGNAANMAAHVRPVPQANVQMVDMRSAGQEAPMGA
ncbi:hypothetical protein DFJ74DRAFT_644203 [Hyaloraphidium curvatum]|nr:hypothetical protein DFJ74DRAFT_644203 [Hyaloraphidium curvatum]